MTILVTGATGFLGSSLVKELVRRGQEVRVLVRNEDKARALFGDTVTVYAGEITAAGPVQAAMEGVDTLYHLAGRLYHPAIPSDLYYQTHVEGTRTLLKACRGQAQLRRIVHVSTTGVHGVTGTLPASEEAPFAPTNPYEQTKLAGEQLALQAYQDEKLPVSVIRPGLVYGPGDLHLLGLFRSIQRGLFRVIAGGQALLHPLYIDDLTAALLLCAASERAPGRVYTIAGQQPVTIHALTSAIARALGRQPARGSIPLWLANLVADAFAITPGLRGERAPLTRSRVAFLTRSRVYDISRAERELGYVPAIELEEGLRRTTAWYRQHHLLTS